jgi:glycosyltransferase involved in cell wall biosynthesis
MPSTLRGGVEEYVLKIAAAGVKAGWEVHTAFPKSEGTASLVKDLTVEGVSYHQLEVAEVIYRKLATVRKYLPYFFRTIALLHHVKPDVVDINLPNPAHCIGSIVACAFLKIPTIVRFHLIPLEWFIGAKERKAHAWAKVRRQQWVTVSENNKKLLCSSFQIPETDVLCIYNGSKLASPNTSVSDLEALKKLRAQVRHELDVPETTQLVLTVGRLENQKGHVDLIPTIPHIAKEFPNVKFVWVGDGKQRENLVNQVQAYGVENQVLFTGYRADIPRLLTTADLFVFPSHYEGHPLALLEAMSYGLPIIASDASSIPEIIKHETHGLLFRTKDSCDLLEALRWALRHPDNMQEMAKNAQFRAQEFPEEKMVREALELWQKLGQISHSKPHQTFINQSTL